MCGALGTADRPKARRRSRAVPRAFSKTVGSRRVVLTDHLNFVFVNSIGGDRTKTSIVCMKNDDRNHKLDGMAGGEGNLAAGAELSR